MASAAELRIVFQGDEADAERAFASIRKGLARVESSAEKAHGKVDAFGGMLGKVSAVAGGFLAAGAIQSAIGGIGDLMGKGIDIGINYNSMLQKNQAAFTQLFGSADLAEKKMGEFQKFAAESPFELPGVLDMARGLKNAGVAADDLIPTMKNVAGAIASTGNVSKEQVDGVSLAVQQMLLKGKVSAEEMNQLAERGLPAWDILAKHLNMSTADVMKSASEGKVAATEMLAALDEAAKSRGWDKLLGELSKSWEGAMSTLTDNLQMAVAKGFKPLFEEASVVVNKLAELASSSDFQDFASGAGAAVKELVGILKEELLPALDATKTAMGLTGDEGMAQFKGLAEFIDASVRVVSSGLTGFARVMKDWGIVVGASLEGVIGGWVALGKVLQAAVSGDLAGAVREGQKGLVDLGNANQKMAAGFVDMLKASGEASMAIFGATGAAGRDANRIGDAFARGQAASRAAATAGTGEGGEVDAFIKFLARRTGLSEAEARGLMDTTDLSLEYAAFKRQGGGAPSPVAAAALAGSGTPPLRAPAGSGASVSGTSGGATYQFNLNGPITFPLPGANDTVPEWFQRVMGQLRAEASATEAGRR